MNGEQTTVEVVQLAAAAFASFPSSCSLLSVREARSGGGFLGRRRTMTEEDWDINHVGGKFEAKSLNR